MALFGPSKKEIEAAEEYILQKLSKVEILDNLVVTVLENEEPWILNCQGYYDECKRKVVIGADSLEILWVSGNRTHDGQPLSEQILGRVGYANTKSGYMPLHSMKNSKGEELVSVGRVVHLWAKIVQERLHAKLPQCKFSDVFQLDGNESRFYYTVPALTFKDWF